MTYQELLGVTGSSRERKGSSVWGDLGDYLALGQCSAIIEDKQGHLALGVERQVSCRLRGGQEGATCLRTVWVDQERGS